MAGDDRIVNHCGQGRLGTGILAPDRGFWANTHTPIDPTNWCVWFEDFLQRPVTGAADVAPWLLTSVDTDADGAAVCTVADDMKGGVLTLTKNDNALDLESLQLNGEMWYLDTGKPLWFESRFRVADVSESNIVIGLCIADTDLYGGMTDGMFFRMDNDDLLDFITEKNSAEQATANVVTLTDNGWVKAGMYWDGIGAIIPYINNVAGTAHKTTLPDDEWLTPSIEMGKGTASVETIQVDWIKVICKR